MNVLAIPALAAVLLTTACANTPDPGPSPSLPPLGTDTPPPSLAPEEARTKAADVSVHEDFEKGAALTGTTDRVEWWTSGPGFPGRIAAASMKTYSGANQMFSADNEPLAVNDWMDTFSTIAGDAHD